MNICYYRRKITQKMLRQTQGRRKYKFNAKTKVTQIIYHENLARIRMFENMNSKTNKMGLSRLRQEYPESDVRNLILTDKKKTKKRKEEESYIGTR